MTFDWEEFLDVAQKLSALAEEEQGQAREALRRTAISRAYYAAFCSTAIWLRRNYPKHPLPEGGEIHRGVIEFFEWHREDEFKQVGALLDRMRKRRNLADYRTLLKDSEQLLERNIFDANRVLNALAGLE